MPASERTHWVHDLDPFLIRFPEAFPVEGIRYYGLAYILAFVLAWALMLAYRRGQRSPLRPGQESDLLTWLIIGVVVGGRLGYMALYRPTDLLSDPLSIFRVWDGGMASHGGFLGVTIALVIFAWKHRIPVLRLGDMVVTLVPGGILLGRVANFINGELWGTVSKVPWAVIFPNDSPRWDPITQTFAIQPRHPSQLYEAFLEGFVLLVYTQIRFWKSRIPPGQLAGEFLFGYGILRFLVEFYREPDASLILGLSRGQFYSIFILAAGAGLIYFSKSLSKEEHRDH